MEFSVFLEGDALTVAFEGKLVKPFFHFLAAHTDSRTKVVAPVGIEPTTL